MKTLLTAACLAFALAGVAHAEDSAADIYKAKCKGCHGDDGKGQTKVGIKEKVADLSTADYQAKHTDADIKKVIVEGSPDNSKMKSFKEKLSEAEIASLVKYVRAFKK